MPTDWTHNHVIFGGTGDTAQRNRFLREDRYWQQSVRRKRMQLAPDEIDRKSPEKSASSKSPIISYPVGPARGVLRGVDKRDWAESTGKAISFTNAIGFPAKYAFDATSPTPDCTNDYVVFALPFAGSNTQMNIIGFNNLYVNNSGTGFCSGTLPTAVFDYNASQNSSAISSPVLSLDGTRIAFIERSTPARFTVLLWKNGDVAATFPNPKNSSGVLSACAASNPTAPCVYSLQYATSPNKTATYSIPFVDYNTDTAYVTADGGRLFAITPVFNGGTPAIASGYPITLGANAMTPPVYDPVSMNVFTADAATGTLYYVRTAAGSSGACASGSPPCKGSTTIALGTTVNPQITDGVFVDSTNGTVFAFTNTAAIVQTNTTLSSTLATASIGTNSTHVLNYSGAFDDNYYTSPSSGFLYACGTTTSGVPTIYRFSFNGSAVMGTSAVSPTPVTLGSGSATCSPLTEVFNDSDNIDYLLLGVGNCAAVGGASTGCLMNFNLTAQSVTTVAESGGTRGIIIDNVANAPSGGTSSTNLYFLNQNTTSTCNKFTSGTTNNVECMIKLTQNGLQ